MQKRLNLNEIDFAWDPWLHVENAQALAAPENQLVVTFIAVLIDFELLHLSTCCVKQVNPLLSSAFSLKNEKPRAKEPCPGVNFWVSIQTFKLRACEGFNLWNQKVRRLVGRPVDLAHFIAARVGEKFFG